MFKLCLIVFTMLLAGSAKISGQNDPECAPLRKSIQRLETAAHDIHCLNYPRNQNLYIVSSQTATRTALSLYRSNDGNIQLLQRLRQNDTYNPAIGLYSTDKPGPDPFILFIASYGAPARKVWVFSLSKQSRLRLLFSKLGGDIEIVHESDEDLISVHEDDEIDVPDLYKYAKGHFVQCDRLYPEYYRKILSKVTSDDAVISPTLEPEMKKLRRLAKN